MGDIIIKILVCFIAGAGAGIGTGFAGMSAAAVIGPMLITFLSIPAYDAVGIGLISDVLASLVSAYTYKKSGNLDIKNSLPLLVSVLIATMLGSFVAMFLPEQAMSGTMQIALIIIGLRFILKPENKRTVGSRFCKEPSDKSNNRRCICWIYMWLCRRRRWNDAAACSDFLPWLSDAFGCRHKCVYNGVYGSYRWHKPLYDRRSPRYSFSCTVRGIYFTLGKNCCENSQQI